MYWVCFTLFFTGALIQKFGVHRIILAGILILFIYLFIAFSGTDFINFITGLFIVGLGWNFLFIGGTSILAKVYKPEEKEKHKLSMILQCLQLSVFQASLQVLYLIIGAGPG